MTENINEVFYRISDNVDSSIYDWKIRAKMYEDLETLKKQLPPTVEMTKEDKQSLLDLKSRATFYYFNQCVEKWQQNRIGLQIPYGGLTEDELMQAWLHPEMIKVVDE